MSHHVVVDPRRVPLPSTAHLIKAGVMAGHLIGSTIILLLLLGSTCLTPPRANILHIQVQTRRASSCYCYHRVPHPYIAVNTIDTKPPTVCLRPSTETTYDLQDAVAVTWWHLLSRSNLQPALSTKSWVATISHSLNSIECLQNTLSRPEATDAIAFTKIQSYHHSSRCGSSIQPQRSSFLPSLLQPSSHPQLLQAPQHQQHQSSPSLRMMLSSSNTGLRSLPSPTLPLLPQVQTQMHI